MYIYRQCEESSVALRNIFYTLGGREFCLRLVLLCISRQMTDARIEYTSVEPHEGEATCVVYSNNQLFSGGADGKIRVGIFFFFFCSTNYLISCTSDSPAASDMVGLVAAGAHSERPRCVYLLHGRE